MHGTYRIATSLAPVYFIGGDEAHATLATLYAGPRTIRRFASPRRFFATAPRLAPAPLLFDMDISEGDPSPVIGRLAQREAVQALIVLTADPDVERAVAAMRAGAIDLLLKPYASDRLRIALDRAYIPRAANAVPAEDAFSRLSNREQEVLGGLSRGLTNKAIAAELGISHRTVEIHRARLMRKLGVTHLSALLDRTFAWQGSIVAPPRN